MTTLESNKPILATYSPPKMTFKNVWAGVYGGHYDIIVFFKKKPKKSKDDFPLGSANIKKWYDCLENKSLIIGDMALCDFQQLYPLANISHYVSTMEIEIVEVFKLRLQAPFDKYGNIEDFRTHIDW